MAISSLEAIKIAIENDTERQSGLTLASELELEIDDLIQHNNGIHSELLKYGKVRLHLSNPEYFREDVLKIVSPKYVAVGWKHLVYDSINLTITLFLDKK
jgi:hypothetical protein